MSSPAVDVFSSPNSHDGSTGIDVVVIVALKAELEAVKEIREGAVTESWHERRDSSGFRY